MFGHQIKKARQCRKVLAGQFFKAPRILSSVAAAAA